MSLTELVRIASDKANFTKLQHYIAFCRKFLEFAVDGLQAVIVSQNEPHYCFYQFREEGHFNVTRPINTRLMIDAGAERLIARDFMRTVKRARDLREVDPKNWTTGEARVWAMREVGVKADVGRVSRRERCARSVSGTRRGTRRGWPLRRCGSGRR